MTIDEILDMVMAELARAESIHPHWPGHDLVHAAGIVSEESGELIRAALRHRYAEGGTVADVRTEAVHTATTAIRLLKNLEGMKVPKPRYILMNEKSGHVVVNDDGSESPWDGLSMNPENYNSEPDATDCDDGEDDYSALEDVMGEALDQAQFGKGQERHANDGEPFEDQKICRGARTFGIGAPLFQASKKIDEAHRMATSGAFKQGRERAIHELLGAINYIAAAVIVLREGQD